MATRLSKVLLKMFPRLNGAHRITSLCTDRYNCFAFVVGDKKRWWWPDACSYWPQSARRDESVASFVEVLGLYGFEACPNGVFERGVEKVAIFAENGNTQHVAIQRTDRNGRWLSKLGRLQDIEHDLDALDEADYGKVVCFMKHRRRRR